MARSSAATAARSWGFSGRSRRRFCCSPRSHSYSAPCFQSRWGTAVAGHGDYAFLLFPGILLHGLLAETITRAPGLVTAVPNYVKKVVFPLELLPLVAVATALFHALIGFAVLAGALVVFRGGLPATAVAVPAIVAPYVVLLLGVAWEKRRQ